MIGWAGQTIQTNQIDLTTQTGRADPAT